MTLIFCPYTEKPRLLRNEMCNKQQAHNNYFLLQYPSTQRAKLASSLEPKVYTWMPE